MSTNIIDNSLTKRVFYFHEFIYFVNSITKTDDRSINNLVNYVIDLLILFDEILIPSEHLTISNNDYEVNFKVKFLSNALIKNLINRERIVTTIWSQCEDNVQHHEVVKRYMVTIGSEKNNYYNDIKNEILGIKIYQRNAAYQSKKAKSYVSKNIKQYDFLIYEDNNILINFSHENLLLGNASKLMLDSNFISNAKEAYINAMPDGNGRVYRSLIYDLEVSIFHNTLKYFPINHPSGINPVLFTYNSFVSILQKIGIKRPSQKVYGDKLWLQQYLNLSDSIAINNFRSEIFPVLEYLSTFSLDSEVEIKHAINNIHIYHFKLDYKAVVFDLKKIFNLQKVTEKYFYISQHFIDKYNAQIDKANKT